MVLSVFPSGISKIIAIQVMLKIKRLVCEDKPLEYIKVVLSSQRSL
jgi:hypothetical protein